MSFILDALKKSESDRQRQSGPALFEVKVAPPRTRLPLWAIAIAVLLVVNLGIVMWMVLRHSAAASPASVTSAANSPAMTGAPGAGAPLTGSAAPNAAVTATGPAPSAVPPPPVPAQATSMSPAPPPPAVVASGPASAAPAAALAAGAVAGGVAANAAGNPDDYAPAAESAPAAAGSTQGGHVRRGTASGVPLYQEASAGTQLPQLRLDLHVYAARPQDRFVMINMHKLREGDSLPEGVQVESITPEGAVLSYNGSRFLLPRE